VCVLLVTRYPTPTGSTKIHLNHVSAGRPLSVHEQPQTRSRPDGSSQGIGSIVGVRFILRPTTHLCEVEGSKIVRRLVPANHGGALHVRHNIHHLLVVHGKLDDASRDWVVGRRGKHPIVHRPGRLDGLCVDWYLGELGRG